MPWLALTLEVERGAAEAFSDALLDAGAQSVSIEAQGMSALLEWNAPAESIVAHAARTAGVRPPRFSVARVDDQDWVRASQAQFVPQEIGARLWVGPHWHQPPPERVAVRIDPGLAFGTGSHATTRLVLAFLERTVKGGERILDYGCGSGILAIAAARLGAAQVDAVDLDPQAVETTRANALANGVELTASPPEALAAASYDIVVSNILAQPLIELAPVLAPRGARIALAGVLDAQAREVSAAYEPWMRMETAAGEEGWALLTGTRR